VTLEPPTARPARAISVLSSSRATSRTVGALAWVVLEELALHADARCPEGWAVETSVREVAGRLMVGKDAVAAALARLADLGLVRCSIRRQAGRYAGCTYVLPADACLRAGLVLITVPADVPPCPVPPGPVPPCPATPCPVEPDPVAPDTATPDAAREVRSEPAAPFPACGPGPTAQSLFDPPQPLTSAPPDPLPLSSSLPSTTPLLPTSQPHLPSPSPLPLTARCQPDALAPSVRRRPVNVAGSRAGGRSALNGNLDPEAG
jgi:hypothetical protein